MSHSPAEDAPIHVWNGNKGDEEAETVTLVLPGKETTQDGLLINSKRLCAVCEEQRSKYKCPRCNMPYCSLGCYRKHGSMCTESFQQQQLAEQMRGTRVSDEEQQNMQRLLSQLYQRFREEEEEEANEDLLVKQMSSMTLDELDAGMLSEEQREDFHRALKDGRLASLLQVWRPWWEAEHSLSSVSGLIQELDEEGNVVGAVEEEVKRPMVLEDVPVLTTGSKGPSPLLGLHVLEVVYVYVHCMRLYNGEWEEQDVEAWELCMRLSWVLGQPKRAAAYAQVSDVLTSLHTRTNADEDTHAMALADTMHVLGDRGNLNAALSDAHAMASACVEHLTRVRKQHEAAKAAVAQADQERSESSTSSTNAKLAQQLQELAATDGQRDLPTLTGRNASVAEDELLSSSSSSVAWRKSKGSSNNNNNTNKSGSKALRTQLRASVAAQRKLVYFLSWVASLSEEAFESEVVGKLVDAVASSA